MQFIIYINEWRPLVAIVVKILEDNLNYRFSEKLGLELMTVVQIWCVTWEKSIEYQDAFKFRKELRYLDFGTVCLLSFSIYTCTQVYCCVIDLPG